MAKFDITTIQGFDTMSDADKVKALLAAELPETDLSGYVSKQTFDTTASNLASVKKQLKDLQTSQLTDAEKLAQDRADFEAERAKFNREKNATTVKGIFATAGLKETDYADLNISEFDNAETATKFANSIVKMLNARADAAGAAARSDLLGGKEPPRMGSNPDKVNALQGAYSVAVKNGNTQEMVRLIREAADIGVQLT